MMRRKAAVDPLVQQDVPARQTLGKLGYDLASGAVAAIPDNGERSGPVVILRQPCKVSIEDAFALDLSPRRGRRTQQRGGLAQLLDRLAEERLAVEHEFEAVML